MSELTTDRTAVGWSGLAEILLNEAAVEALSDKERELLWRFYLDRETPEQVCREMGLSDTQFRLLKSNAKRHFLASVQPSATPPAAPISASGFEIVPVVAHAVGVFGDERKASHWLSTPLPFFGGRSPAQILETADGIELVEQVLTRIEHNIPS